MVEVTEPTRFERGQLILAPFKGRDVLWTVVRVKPNGKAHLLAGFEHYHCEITTTVAEVPSDWHVITQDDVIFALVPVKHRDGGVS
jgi:hypothetical protein